MPKTAIIPSKKYAFCPGVNYIFLSERRNAVIYSYVTILYMATITVVITYYQ